jgi:iron complex transport system substrate-binding protein
MGQYLLTLGRPWQRLWRALRYGLIAVGLAVAIAACQPQPTAAPATPVGPCRSIAHAVGTTEICGQPQRIAVLGPHMLDLLLSLGLQPAGYAEFATTGIGEPTADIPVLGDLVTTQPLYLGLRNTPSLEALVRLQPDLILGEAFIQTYYPQLSQIAPTLLYPSSQKDEWQQGLQGVAQALNRQAQAEQVIAAYEETLASTREALAPITAAHPQILLISAYQLPKSLVVVEPSSYLGGLFTDMGFEVVTPAGGATEGLSVETLPMLDQADTILAFVSDHMQDGAMSRTQQFWQRHPITQSLAASQNQRVYFLDAYLWFNIRGPIAATRILTQIPNLLNAPARSPTADPSQE